MLDKCSTTDILLFCLFSFVWGRAHAHHILHVGGEGQRTILRSQFSPSTRSILELELRLPGLVASTLTYRATLPNLDFFFYCESGSHYIGQIGTGVMILLLSLPGSWDYRPAAQTWLLFSRVMGI